MMGGMSAERQGSNEGRRIFYRYVLPLILLLSIIISLLLNWAAG